MHHKHLNQKYYTIAFTPDKPMNDMRMILGNNTPCPQKGNENELIHSLCVQCKSLKLLITIDNMTCPLQSLHYIVLSQPQMICGS